MSPERTCERLLSKTFYYDNLWIFKPSWENAIHVYFQSYSFPLKWWSPIGGTWFHQVLYADAIAVVDKRSISLDS